MSEVLLYRKISPEQGRKVGARRVGEQGRGERGAGRKSGGDRER